MMKRKGRAGPVFGLAFASKMLFTNGGQNAEVSEEVQKDHEVAWLSF